MMSYWIEKLQVTNFRNLLPDIVTFSPGINCILGENGNGKTNLLEAIHVLTLRKSFRKNTSFPQYLGFDGEQPEIIFSSTFTSYEKERFSYSVKLLPSSGQYFLDGKPVKKKPDFKLVFINPFDNYNFHTTASFRRQWFDQHLSQLDREYKISLKQYHNRLKFRNTLLTKKPSQYAQQIAAIDPDIAEQSVILTQKRIQFLEDLYPFCHQTFKDIFSEEHDLELKLQTRVGGMNSDQILRMLNERWDKDDNAGHTTYGVHKDDYELLFDGLNAYEFCSLGQQKMSYLSLLFAYISLFGYKYKSFPIVLIDDVSGELDRFRWRRLIDYLKRSQFQVLITTANENFKEELEKISGANRVYVDSGSFTQTLNKTIE